MDKKKKRASFSMDSSSGETPVKKEKKTEEKSASKNEVNIIVEEEIIKTPSNVNIIVEEEIIKTPSSHINIVIPTDEVIIKQKPVTDELPVVEGVDDLPKHEVSVKANDFIEEDEDEESTVTASATPDGDSVLLTEETEELPVTQEIPQTHKKVHPAPVETPVVLPESSTEEETQPALGKEEVENVERTTPEEKAEVARPPMTIHKGPSGSETTTERQQEQVAELFNKNASANMPEITVHQQSNTRGIILWAVTMIAIALGVGGGLVLFTTRNNNNASSSNQVVVSSPTPGSAEPTAMPSATPTPVALKREDISVQVLNGGGNSGAGSRMEEFLVDLGYTVSDVSNADAYTYENTVIVTKASNTEVADLLESDLSGTYELDESVATLSEDSEFDVQVIVGSNE